MKYHLVWFAVLGHIFTDINQGIIPTLLPFFISEYNLTYAAAAGLVSASSIASTVIQPLFGYYSDRFSKPWFIPIGVLLAGYGVAFCGSVPNYWFSVFMIVISGIGIAAFHPEGARLVHSAAGEKKATGISIFGIGGQVGIAIGPIVTTTIVALWGLKGTLSLTVPSTIMATLLAVVLLKQPTYQVGAEAGQYQSAKSTPKENWSSFIFLTAIVICRSIIFYGLNIFVPLYWIHILNQSKSAGGFALSIMLVAGISGNLIGGRLADKYGYRNVILSGFGALIPLLFSFALFKNVNVVTVLLIPIGIALISTYSPLVVLGQKYLPNRIGFASGITLGVAVAIGGIVAPLLGSIADGYGIPAVLIVLAILPVLAVMLSIMLTPPRTVH